MINLSRSACFSDKTRELINQFNNNQPLSGDNVAEIFREIILHKTEIEISSPRDFLRKVVNLHPSDSNKRGIYALAVEVLLGTLFSQKAAMEDFVEEFYRKCSNPGEFIEGMDQFTAILKLIPFDGRNLDTIAALKTLFHLKKLDVELIKNTPEGERANQIKKMEETALSILFKTETSTRQALENISEKEQLSLMRLLCNVEFDHRRRMLLEAVIPFSSHQRLEAACYLKIMIQNIWMGPDVAQVLNQVNFIPLGLRLRVMQQACHHRDGFGMSVGEIIQRMNGARRQFIEKQLNELVKNKRIDGQKAEEIKNSHFVYFLIAAFDSIPSAVVSSKLIQDLTDTFTEVEDDATREKIISLFKDIPEEAWQNAEFLWVFCGSTALRVLERVPSPARWSYIKFIHNLPINNCLINTSIQLLLNIPKDEDLPAVIDALSKDLLTGLSEEEQVKRICYLYSQPDLIFSFNSLMKLLDSSSRDSFVQFLNYLEENEMELLLDELIKSPELLKGDIVANILNHFENIRRAFYVNVETLLNSHQLSKVRSASSYILLNKNCLKLEDDHPLVQRSSLIQSLLPFTTGINDDDAMPIIYEICSLPPEDREEMIKKLTELFEKKEADGPMKMAVIYAMSYFPPESKKRFISILDQHSDVLPSEMRLLIQLALLQISEDESDIVYKHLFNVLESLTDPAEAKQLATSIWENLTSFCIYEEHYLAQKALHTMLMTEDMENPKNPFRIYQMHQENASVETPIDFPRQEIAGKRVTFNSVTLQNKAKEKKQVTFGELPQGIGPGSIKKHFDALYSRLDGLDQTKRENTLSYIAEINEGYSLDYLRENFANDLYLQTLLATKGKSDSIASAEVVEFFAILKALDELSNIVEEGQMLSPREDMLLKISNSIQLCSIGKSEGISLAYNYVKNYSGELAQLPAAEQAIYYLDSLFQTILRQAFGSESAMMRELIQAEQGTITQGYHQSLYLKNLIGAKVGLQHGLKYDPHTYVLYDTLVEKSSNEVEVVFCKHFPPRVLIDELIKNFNTDKEVVKPLFHNIESLLGPTINHDQIYDANEDQTVFMLNEQGALQIWMRAGYLQVDEIEVNR